MSHTYWVPADSIYDEDEIDGKPRDIEVVLLAHHAQLVALVKEWADAHNNWVSYDGKSGDRVMKAEAALLAYRRGL